MATTLKWTKRIGLALLALVAIAAILWAISRALYPTAGQREALAVMQLPEPPEGKNAFGALWTLDRAVPPDKVEQVLRRDAARIANLPQFRDPEDPASEFVSAAEQYTDLAPSPEDLDLFCNPEREGCLEKVAGDPSTYRDLTERHRELLDRIDALADYDFVRQRLPWHLSASIVVPGNAGLSSTRHALWFTESRVDDALAAACRGIDTWRRLGAAADTLILRVIANRYATRYHGRLVTEMLVGMPLDHALPPECAQALAPPTPQELSLCAAMRGEFEMITEVTGPMLKAANSRNWWSSLLFFLAYDAEATTAISAQHLAPICSERELERVASDQPDIDRPEPQGVWRFACIGNFTGCVLSSIATPSYGSYRIRMQDFGARLKLLATLAWLRENADRSRPLTALVAERPDAFKSPTRPVEIGDDGKSLQIRMFDDFAGQTWSVPLPSALQEQPGP